jgi:23S rRNA U2552 (ribose-2'-O)-methylase RlmE/FtsJ
MTRRTPGSSRWLLEHFSDPYVKRAQAEGWRSRAVFKLEEADKKERMLRRGQVVPDLGAVPGAWSTYARVKVGPQGKVIASEMAGKVLKPGGGALIKVFQGAVFQELTAAARRQFKTVRFLKPAASRARSAEIYLLASGLRLV